MIALIQRVTQGSVTIDGKVKSKIEGGLVVLLGVEQNDDQHKVDRLCERVLGYRIFADEQGKMNLNVQQVKGSLLVVSQFTLVADTEKGMRPSFSQAATPKQAEQWYEYFIAQCRNKGIKTETGCFAADMQLNLVNDGPVTFWLQT